MTAVPAASEWTETGMYWQHKQKQSGYIFEIPTIALPLCLFRALPPASLSLSSPPLKRHMALWHTAHSVLTSSIPWNTSSAASPFVVPGSQSRPPLPSPLTPPPSLHPPTLGLILRHQWLPLRVPIARSPRLSEPFHPAPLLPVPAAVWSVENSSLQKEPNSPSREGGTVRLVRDKHGGKGEKGFDDHQRAQLSRVSLLRICLPFISISIFFNIPNHVIRRPS